MKLTNLLTLAPLLPSALALALTTAPPYPTTNNSTTNATVTPPTRYYLQTQVTGSGAANAADKNGLYVSAYHTGAGENDATLESSIDVASVGYLNGTNQQFDLNSDFPWGFVMVLYDYYAGTYLTSVSPHCRFLVREGGWVLVRDKGLMFDIRMELRRCECWVWRFGFLLQRVRSAMERVSGRLWRLAR